MGTLMPLAGYIGDFIIKRGILSVKHLRMLRGGLMFQFLFMIIAAYILNEIAIIACLTLGVGLGAFTMAGSAVNQLDVAPEYATTLKGFISIFATIPGRLRLLHLKPLRFQLFYFLRYHIPDADRLIGNR